MRLIKNTENSEDLKALTNNDNDIVNIQLFGVALYILPSVK